MRSGPAALLSLVLLAPSALAQARCDNVLSPVNAGWVWTYSWQDVEGKRTRYEQRRAPTSQGFATTTGADAQASREEYRCAGGAQTSLTAPSISGVEITRASVAGVSVPPAQGWRVGQTWDLTWNMEGRKGLLRGQGTVGTQYEVVGREKVIVPAGTFDAWKVSTRTQLKGKVAGISLNQPTFTSTMWFAEGVGLVRQTYPKGAGLELLSLKK